MCISYLPRVSPVTTAEVRNQGETEPDLPPQGMSLEDEEEHSRADMLSPGQTTHVPQPVEMYMGDRLLCDFRKDEVERENLCNFEKDGELIFLCMRAVMFCVFIFVYVSDCVKKLLGFLNTKLCDTSFSPLVTAQPETLFPPANHTRKPSREGSLPHSVTAEDTCHPALRSRPRINGRPPDSPTCLAAQPRPSATGTSLYTCRDALSDTTGGPRESKTKIPPGGIFVLSRGEVLRT